VNLDMSMESAPEANRMTATHPAESGSGPDADLQSPVVSCVVINWNQPDLTLDCLASLDRSTYPVVDVIVVDNASTDDSVVRIRTSFPAVTLLESPTNVGYSDGNNVGIRHALHEGAQYVLLLNNDTTVDSTMVEELVRQAEADPTIGIVGPRQFYHDVPSRLWGSANYVDWSRGQMRRVGMGEAVDDDRSNARVDPVVDADYIDTCAALVRREVFERVGLMDSRYFLNFEDADLGVRARQVGFRIVHVPSARMWHKVSSTMGPASPATTYYMTRNALLFFWTHGRGLDRLTAIASIAFRTIRTIGAWSVKSAYRSDVFRRRRAANIYALRDFALGRFGPMAGDVASACSGR
jgi:GT2 family glycosyltransferase